jgi:hypothetical protein
MASAPKVCDNLALVFIPGSPLLDSAAADVLCSLHVQALQSGPTGRRNGTADALRH